MTKINNENNFDKSSPKTPSVKKVSEHDLDRDKNEVYIANDESIVDLIDLDGKETFTHPYREISKFNPKK